MLPERHYMCTSSALQMNALLPFSSQIFSLLDYKIIPGEQGLTNPKIKLASPIHCIVNASLQAPDTPILGQYGPFERHPQLSKCLRKKCSAQTHSSRFRSYEASTKILYIHCEIEGVSNPSKYD